MFNLSSPYLAVGFLLLVLGGGAEATTYDTIIDSKTGVRVSIPIEIVGRDSTNQQYGSNWGFRASNLSIDTLNFGSTRTLSDLYNAMRNKAGRVVTNSDFRPDDSFFLKGIDDRGTTQFQVRVRQANGEIRGLSIMYDTSARARLEPVVMQVLSSFEPFPGRVTAVATVTKPPVATPPVATIPVAPPAPPAPQPAAAIPVAPSPPPVKLNPPQVAAVPGSITPICPADDRPNMRIALVIGNSKYQSGGALTNPRNDAVAMTQALRELGFTVIDGVDLGKREMELKIRQFNRMIGQADGQPMALVFYAGHGIQYGGKNYLIPVDAKLERNSDLEIDGIDLELVLSQMTAATTCVNLVLLDACRNNPLVDKGKGGGWAEPAAGFAFDPSEKRRETYIVFSTASNELAYDGDGKNSPFTDALLKNIYAPGLDFQLMMRKVRHDVTIATKQLQRPKEYGDITKSIILLPKPLASASAGGPMGGPITRSFENK
jgi:Caspase domain